MVALSFVRTAADIKRVHEIMDAAGGRLPVLAKIEKPQAVDNLEEIVDAFDGLMVARGDLGVEMPLERVPLVQKRCVQMAREQAKPVIVATQMLESMIGASRPTRAEASDVANAVLDGADAVMLSGETSVGSYPVEAVATMSRIITAAEEDLGRVPRSERADTASAAPSPGRAAGRRRVGASASSPSRRAATRPAAARRAPLADPAARLHARAGGPQPARADLGRRDVPRAPRCSTPTTWSARSTAPCSASAGCSRGSSSRSSPAARPPRPARPTRCGCTGWAPTCPAVRPVDEPPAV
jgi:hypothetical protein